MSSTDLNALVAKLNAHSKNALQAATEICQQYGHTSVEIEHWLLCLLNEQSDIYKILQEQQINTANLGQSLRQQLENFSQSTSTLPTISSNIITWLKEAWLVTSMRGDTNIRSADLLLGLLQSQHLKQLLNLIHKECKVLTFDIAQALSAKTIDLQQSEGLESSHKNIMKNLSKTPNLDQYTINLNQLALENKIDAIIGREAEINEALDILLRRRQNNPILVGDPGVGKTAIVEGLALKITQTKVPQSIRNVVIHTLDMGLLMAGASLKGEFEKRLKGVITEARSSEHPIILFIDEAHTIIGAGNNAGGMDAANLLKPALARGELRTIAATTWSEYKQYFEQDAALVRRFQTVKVAEPNDKTCIDMLHTLKIKMQQHHGVIISDEALEDCVKLSRRYVPERRLPDKAISILDTACARVSLSQQSEPLQLQRINSQISLLDTRLSNLESNPPLSGKAILIKQLHKQKKDLSKHKSKIQGAWKKQQNLVGKINVASASNKDKQRKSLYQQLLKLQNESLLVPYCVNSTLVKKVISDWTGVPLDNMQKSSLSNVTRMKAELKKSIKGQDHAIEKISNRIKQAYAKLNDPDKPLGVFLFTGPSGVGKTHMAKGIAKAFFGSIKNMTVINMCEFKEEHKISMLMGSPPGYVGYDKGGVLTESVRRKPYQVILLDEIEKAHRSIQQIFYQIFDQGEAKDSQGIDINFRNTLIIMTANIGVNTINNHSEEPPDEIETIIKPELENHFDTALLGRMSIIPFLPLNDQLARDIIQMKLTCLSKRATEQHGIPFDFSDSDINKVVDASQYQDAGARDFDRVIDENMIRPFIENSLNT